MAMLPTIPRVMRVVRAAYSAMVDGGYAVPGSSRKAMKGVRATANSPDVDIIDKLPGMRALSRDGYMSSPIATAILRRNRALGIGSGLQLQSIIDHKFLGLSSSDARRRGREIEREFDLWANSPFADFGCEHWFGDLQALGYFNLLLSGDFFFMPVWRVAPDPLFPYQLAIKLIDADLVRDPVLPIKGQDVKGGVHVEGGRAVGYYVWNSYPNEQWDPTARPNARAEYVPKWDTSGRQQIFHVFFPERFNQRRGVPLMAPAAEKIKQITRLEDAELMNALVASMFTAVIRDQSGYGSMPGLPASTDGTIMTGGTPATGANGEVEDVENRNDVKMAYGNIFSLDAQKDVTLLDPHKTDVGFEKFWTPLATTIAAVGNTPVEQATMKYNKSYTAARAAMNDVWIHRNVDRTLISRKMGAPVVREQMAEAIMRGRIVAPKFFEDYAYQRAWSRSRWVGPGQGSLNPLQEAKAAVLRVNSKLTNRSRVAQDEQGGRWDETVDQLQREDDYLEELGIVDEPDLDELVGPDGQRDEEEEHETDTGT